MVEISVFFEKSNVNKEFVVYWARQKKIASERLTLL